MDKKLWNIIGDMYMDAKCSVLIGGEKSDWFTVGQGVHQGAPMSMLLFNLYMNPLLLELKVSNVGAHIADENVRCPAFADDVALLALSERSLQMLVDIAFVYNNKWRFTFNAKKSYYMVFGKGPNNGKVVLGNNDLKEVNEIKHLGTILKNDIGTDVDFIQSKITSGRRATYAVLSIGSKFNPVSPLSIDKVYKSQSLSRMLYGVEVANISEKSVKLLESSHWAIARSIQGLSKTTPNPHCSSINRLDVSRKHDRKSKNGFPVQNPVSTCGQYL